MALDLIHDAVLRGVLDDQRDDLARLAYADCLEEDGDLPRARFVRLGVQMRGLALTARQARRMREQSLRAGREPLGGLPELCDLLLAHGTRWLAPWTAGEGWDTQDWTWEGGFLAGVELPEVRFLNVAPGLFRSWPIVDVLLVDRHPWKTNTNAEWFCGKKDGTTSWGIARLNQVLWEHLPGGEPFVWTGDGSECYAARRYRDEGQATEALSAACVAWGRQQAGLPLPPRPSEKT